jgi:hypothetical protein
MIDICRKIRILSKLPNIKIFEVYFCLLDLDIFIGLNNLHFPERNMLIYVKTALYTKFRGIHENFITFIWSTKAS